MNYLKTKRTLDILFSAVGIVTLLPLFILISILIYLDNPGPIFFYQQRVGYKGKKFMILKFRTMVVNAESLLLQLEGLNQAGNNVLFKSKEDPRITKVGKFLRKSSLDELPQLYNILKGDMSLIGPRCLSIRDWNLLPDDFKDRTDIPQGLSGLWQVSKNRWNLSMEEIYKLDRYYIDNCSLWLDIKIILLTFIVVLTKRNF